MCCSNPPCEDLEEPSQASVDDVAFNEEAIEIIKYAAFIAIILCGALIVVMVICLFIQTKKRKENYVLN